MRSFAIAGPCGDLEATLQEAAHPRGAAVLCHPHPLHGGTMNNRVVYRAAKAVVSAGLHALRFNFRGVGASAGTFGEGAGEQQDVSAALDWLSERRPGMSLAVVGFSFGAWVGLQVGTRDERVKALVGLGVPLNRYDFEFLTANSKPTLLASGDRDEFCPAARMRRLAARLPANSEVRYLEGADHFFSGNIDLLQGLLLEFLRTVKF
jgi:alpha/beta superfamily hydrolase